ncbi:MAG: hypothetical protein FJW14_11870 [Acidimicrobiia bacterium]|nr:hypothetical protein [Acidimicrobiia bacterium]
MQKQSIRIALLTILLAGGLAAGLFLRHLERRAADLRAADADLSARVARLTDALVDIAAAQHAYITPGQGGEPWFEKMAMLVRQLYDDTSALSARLHAPDAHASVEGLTGGIEALVAADARVRENLRLGQPLMAADVIFSDSQNTIDTMLGRLRDLRAAEARALDAAHSALASQRWLTFGGLAVLWLGGIALLFRVPGVPTVPEVPGVPRVPEVPAPAVELTAVAALCTDLSRVSSAATLPELLGRAAAIVEAPGLILWMAAGEELFAVTAHGYSPQILAKVGPISRKAENATAAAWREGRAVTVPAEAGGPGAVVAPLFGADGCIGVLAAELRAGRETDSSAQAVIALIAAQLSTVVSAWPAASSAELRAQASA